MGYASRMNAGKKQGYTGLIRPDGRATSGGKVVMGYPVGGSVTLPFHASVLRLLGHELGKEPDVRLLRRINHVSGLYVGDNRTLLAQRFLEMDDAEWLLQVDTDIEFPQTLLETLVGMAGSERKIMAASVPLGAFPGCAFKLTDRPGVWDPIWPIPMEPTQVDGVATAVVLIHRDVFNGIAERHGQCWFHHIYLPQHSDADARKFKFLSQGEDLAFSVRALEAGFKIWCAHVPGIGHFKTRRLSHDDESGSALFPTDSEMGELVQEG